MSIQTDLKESTSSEGGAAPREFTDSEGALLRAWDERIVLPSNSVLEARLLAAYNEMEESSLSVLEIQDEVICMQMIKDALVDDVADDFEDTFNATESSRNRQAQVRSARFREMEPVDTLIRAHTEEVEADRRRLAARRSRLPLEAARHSRLHQPLMIALAAIMLSGIAAGLVYTRSQSGQWPLSKQVESVLEIESTPSGAALLVDGEPTGLRTPTTLTGIKQKQLLIRLELPNHVPVTRDIDVLAGRTTSVHIELTPLKGRLVISDLPLNASIFVDTEEYAAGDVITVMAGKHMIRIVVEGRTTTEQSIDTASGDQRWRLVHGKLVPD